jgi:hypothetical protein
MEGPLPTRPILFEEKSSEPSISVTSKPLFANECKNGHATYAKSGLSWTRSTIGETPRNQLVFMVETTASSAMPRSRIFSSQLVKHPKSGVHASGNEGVNVGSLHFSAGSTLPALSSRAQASCRLRGSPVDARAWRAAGRHRARDMEARATCSEKDRSTNSHPVPLMSSFGMSPMPGRRCSPAWSLKGQRHARRAEQSDNSPASGKKRGWFSLEVERYTRGEASQALGSVSCSCGALRPEGQHNLTICFATLLCHRDLAHRVGAKR